MTVSPQATPRHLACLHEITRLFLHAQEGGAALSEVFAAVVTTLPLRSAVLIEERRGAPRAHLWNAPSAPLHSAERAAARAKEAYAYLADYDDRQREALKETAPSVLATLKAAPCADDEDDRFIVLPLVVGATGVFGALQLQCASALDEADLAFVDAVTSELALALDRQYAWETRGTLLATAEAAVRSRDQTLDAVSHDLRTLLTGVLLLSSIGSKAGSTPARQHHLFGSIEGTAQRMERIIADLVDAASIDSGRLSIKHAPRPVAPLVIEALALMRPLALAKALRLDCKLAGSLPRVLADGGRILQVFTNLLSNAIKHSPEGGAIRIGAERSDGGVRFSVVDSGAGIDPLELPRVFDRYWRSGEGAGAGLGLFITRGIVEAHGGRIWVESQPGHGAHFYFTLPAA